jgi:hypothetical protein
MADTYLVSREGDINYWGFDFCPFCGKDIKNKSEYYHKVIKDELGIDTKAEEFDMDKLDEILTEEFKSDEWWKKRGL